MRLVRWVCLLSTSTALSWTRSSESDASIQKQVLLELRPCQTHLKKTRHHEIRPTRAPKKRTGRSRMHLALETHLLNINAISRGSIINVGGFTSKSPVIRDFLKPGWWADAKKWIRCAFAFGIQLSINFYVIRFVARKPSCAYKSVTE